MSSADFDPYLEWLEIPPQRRPPTYYDLLGLAAFECDPERIQQAALKRIELVRRYKVGRREDAASQLEHELTQAWNCLRDAERKKEYDATLRGASTLHAPGQQTVSEASETHNQAETAIAAPAVEQLAAAPSATEDVIEAKLVSPPVHAYVACVGGTETGLGRDMRLVSASVGESPIATESARIFPEAGRSTRARVAPLSLRTLLAIFVACIKRLSPRTVVMGALTIALSITAVLQLPTGGDERAESRPPLETPVKPVPSNREGWQRGLATVELVDSSGRRLGHTTMAYFDRFKLGLICLRGFEQGIPLKAITPQGATVFFRGAIAMDPETRLVAASTEGVGIAMQPLVVQNVLPTPGTTLTLAWCEAAGATPTTVRGTVLRACRGNEAAAQVSDPGMAFWLAHRSEPLLQVETEGGSIPAGAVALNDRQEVVGVVAWPKEAEPFFLLSGSTLYRLLSAAEAIEVRPVDEVSEDLARFIRSEQKTPVIAAGMEGESEPNVAELPRSDPSPLLALGPELEAALTRGELGNPPPRFPPLRVDDDWTIRWEDLFDARTISSRLNALPRGKRVEVLAADNPEASLSYVAHIRDGQLHGWAAVVSANGILRFVGGFIAGRPAGPHWWYDERGQLVVYFDFDSESRANVVFLGLGHPVLVLKEGRAASSGVYVVRETPSGLQLDLVRDKFLLSQVLEEIKIDDFEAEIRTILASMIIAIDRHGILRGN